MTNEQNIQYYKLGKFNIDISKLSNDGKIKFLIIENLLKALIKFYDETQELSRLFNNANKEITKGDVSGNNL